MLNIFDLFNFYNKHQILKTRQQHNILVAVMCTFALLCNVFDCSKYLYNVTLIMYIRVIDIIVHNISVAYFDKYRIENNKLIITDNISSYKRILILNTIVLFELMMYSRFINLIIILIAFLPTSYLLFKCFDKYFETKIRKELDARSRKI